MDDALLRETLARLMRERVPEADEQAKEEEEPSVMQLSQERYLIHQMIAEVKAELADEELEVKEEITDADILQKWCQPVSSSSAADADASNAAASSAADADASKEEPEAARVSASTKTITINISAPDAKLDQRPNQKSLETQNPDVSDH